MINPKVMAPHLERGTTKKVIPVFVSHDPELGEKPADDCYITIPASPASIANMATAPQSGLWTAEEFRLRFARL